MPRSLSITPGAISMPPTLPFAFEDVDEDDDDEVDEEEEEEEEPLVVAAVDGAAA